MQWYKSKTRDDGRGWSPSLITRFECRNGHERSSKECKGCLIADPRWRDWLAHEIEMEEANNATKYSQSVR